MVSTNDKLLQAIRSRGQKNEPFDRGILTADRHVANLRDRIGSDACYQYACQVGNHTSFDDILQKAAKTLVYSNDEMVVEEKGLKVGGLATDLVLPKNTLMVFRHVLTTSTKDRDGDILHPEGADVDPKMLLLWQHMHTLPIGKLIQIVEQNKNRLVNISVIVDMNETSHDAAVMVDNDMGRFSHGFRALEFTEDKGSGFDVTKYEIMEESLVSVPANKDAESEEILLSLVEGGKLTSPIMKEMGKQIREAMPVTVPVKLDLTLSLNGKEISDANQSADNSGRGSKDIDATSEETNGEGGREGKEETKDADSEVKASKVMVGVTEETNDHTHRVRLSEDGDGETSKDAGHSHVVERFKVLEADDHTHELDKDGLVERGKSMEDTERKRLTDEQMEMLIRMLSDKGLFSFDFSRPLQIENEKAGRSISKANENRIRNAAESVDEAIGMEGTPRPVKAMLREASKDLGAVLSSLGSDDDEGKSLTTTTAISHVLAFADVGERKGLLSILHSMEDIDKQNKTAKQFRSMLGWKRA